MEIDAHTPDLVAVGIDGRPASRVALAWAAQEARAHGRQLAVYHCWQPPMPVTAVMAGGFAPIGTYQDTLVCARAVLDDTMGWLRHRYPTVHATAALLEGPPGRRLTAHARRDDLLVLGLGTRHRIAARMLGSTVEYAMRHARGTVVVVPPEDQGTAQGPFAGHVVAAVESHEGAGAIIGAAFAEAAAHGWPLAVVHVDQRRHRAVGPVPAQSSPDAHLFTGAVLSWHARYPQVTVHRATFDGRPAAALEQATLGARLLVIGRTAHPLALVNVADLLLAKTTCPIAVTPLSPAVAELTREPELARLVTAQS